MNKMIAILALVLATTSANAAVSHRDGMEMNSGALINHVEALPMNDANPDQVAWGRCCVSVRGYTRRNGTYVRPHIRTYPDNNRYNNFSSRGSSWGSYWW